MGRVARRAENKPTARKAMLEEVEEALANARERQEAAQSIVGLLKLKAQLIGIDAPPPPKRKPPKLTGDHLVDHLATLRDLLRTALDRGSVDSAARLTGQIEKCVERLEARAAEKRARDLEGMSEDQVVEMVVSDLMELPLPLRLRIRQALTD